MCAWPGWGSPLIGRPLTCHCSYWSVVWPPSTDPEETWTGRLPGKYSPEDASWAPCLTRQTDSNSRITGAKMKPHALSRTARYLTVAGWLVFTVGERRSCWVRPAVISSLASVLTLWYLAFSFITALTTSENVVSAAAGWLLRTAQQHLVVTVQMPPPPKTMKWNTSGNSSSLLLQLRIMLRKLLRTWD